MKALHGVDSMPETAENVADEFAVSREDQDAFALRSQQRWAAAAERGYFAREILPVTLPQKKGEPIVMAADEHPRPDTTLETLAKLKGVVRPDGSVTAGNASGVERRRLCGAAGVRRCGEAVRPHAAARILGAAAAGVPPRIMGIGPAPATEKLLARLGLALDRFDVIELNEAFAAQALAVTRRLGLADDDMRVNPNGGAIAIGHPLGAPAHAWSPPR